ncbi:MAG TPA: hypothetical protein VFS05_14795 [Gemmatimonadaceae bacterium]|nr:hypothetical protein [Gemmatimonadaceae bacterium]
MAALPAFPVIVPAPSAPATPFRLVVEAPAVLCAWCGGEIRDAHAMEHMGSDALHAGDGSTLGPRCFEELGAMLDEMREERQADREAADADAAEPYFAALPAHRRVDVVPYVPEF